MGYRNIIALLCVAVSVASCTTDRGLWWSSDAGAMAGYSSGYGSRDGGPAPEADPDRKISERDCTRPFDRDSANLLCR